MLSDSLFEAREAILDAVRENSEYAGTRRQYIVQALANLDLAMMALDTVDVPDTHIYGRLVQGDAEERGQDDFDQALTHED